MVYTPMTELEAVNAMLEIINEQPVNSLETTIPEVEIAKQLLYRVSREVQSPGLHCNSEEEYYLQKDMDGKVSVPPNALSMVASNPYLDLTTRGRQVYDKTNHTFDFTDGVRVDIVFFLPFEELPEHVRAYITVRAARQYQARMLVSTEIHQMTESDEYLARAAFKREEIMALNKNMLAGNGAMSSTSYRRR